MESKEESKSNILNQSDVADDGIHLQSVQKQQQRIHSDSESVHKPTATHNDEVVSNETDASQDNGSDGTTLSVSFTVNISASFL